MTTDFLIIVLARIGAITILVLAWVGVTEDSDYERWEYTRDMDRRIENIMLTVAKDNASLLRRIERLEGYRTGDVCQYCKTCPYYDGSRCTAYTCLGREAKC